RLGTHCAGRRIQSAGGRAGAHVGQEVGSCAMLNITFGFPPGSSKLASRSLVIKDAAAPIGSHNTAPPFTSANTVLSTTALAGTDEEATVELPENRVLEAILTDTAVGGLTSNPERLVFQTTLGGFSFPQGSGRLRIIAVEEESSSSSPSSSSSSSS